MTFGWPYGLLALLVVPLLVLGYRRLAGRRDARRAELAALGFAQADGRATGRRRHLVPGLYLVALTLLLAALSRPEATVAQARREGTVVLAFDVSASMRATDVAPSRLDAAKAAARRFVERQPASVRVAVVAFGESGLVTQQPTNDKAQVLSAIDRLSPSGGTALGRGIQTSLAVIAGKPVPLPGDDRNQGQGQGQGQGQPQGQGQGQAQGGVEATGPDLGYYGSAAVILLSDGENTSEPDPPVVAELASTAGVKVYTIGLGSPQGTVLAIEGFRVATALDEQALRQIATTTGGQYYAAPDESRLAEVYGAIDPLWTVRPVRTEITALLAGAAALLLLIGAATSIVRHGRVM